MLEVFKIDNMKITTYVINEFLINAYIQYKNNENQTSLIYSIKENQFYATSAGIDKIFTDRQKNIFIKKIKKLYEGEIYEGVKFDV